MPSLAGHEWCPRRRMRRVKVRPGPGPHDEAADPFVGEGDFFCVQHGERRFHHAPDLQIHRPALTV